MNFLNWRVEIRHAERRSADRLRASARKATFYGGRFGEGVVERRDREKGGGANAESENGNSSWRDEVVKVEGEGLVAEGGRWGEVTAGGNKQSVRKGLVRSLQKR